MCNSTLETSNKEAGGEGCSSCPHSNECTGFNWVHHIPVILIFSVEFEARHSVFVHTYIIMIVMLKKICNIYGSCFFKITALAYVHTPVK